MKKALLLAFVSVIGIIVWAGCGNSEDGAISEGVIEYNASVVDQSNPMANMAPNKMIITFKDNKSSAEMSAGMGLFSTSFISDPQAKTLTQLVKLLNKKFLLVQNESDIKKENDGYPVEITELKDTKQIAGFKCKKAHVKVLGDEPSEFDVYYTTELKIQNPNFANPFNKINGVLMEYQMKKFGLEMKFTAKTVKREDVDDAVFETPPDYKKISPQEMKELFEGLQ
jgi:GLPGLI family protein